MGKGRAGEPRGSRGVPDSMSPKRDGWIEGDKGGWRVFNLTRGKVLCRDLRIADGFRRRAVGMMFKRSWDDGDGLLLSPCGSIHTFWMRMAIDVCFLDHRWEVVKAVPGVRPWRCLGGGRRSRATLELPAGTLAATGTRGGDRLALTEGGEVTDAMERRGVGERNRLPGRTGEERC